MTTTRTEDQIQYIKGAISSDERRARERLVARENAEQDGTILWCSACGPQGTGVAGVGAGSCRCGRRLRKRELR